MSIAAYRALTWAAGPLIHRYMQRRLNAGREDPQRFRERFGDASATRPDGPLVWLHASSVGESLSMLSLIERLRRERLEVVILMTSGTVSSARILENRLPLGVIHQFVPVDRMSWVRRFLDHWQPDLVLWVESEFWPGVLSEVKRRAIPAMLMNARISARSWRGWRRAPWMIRRILQTFDLCMAQTELDAERLRDLGAVNIACPGNLKFAAEPLPADPDTLAALEAATAARPRWLAFSTHPGEEETIAAAHRILVRNLPDILTIIVPRHPARGPEIEKILAASGTTREHTQSQPTTRQRHRLSACRHDGRTRRVFPADRHCLCRRLAGTAWWTKPYRTCPARLCNRPRPPHGKFSRNRKRTEYGGSIDSRDNRRGNRPRSRHPAVQCGDASTPGGRCAVGGRWQVQHHGCRLHASRPGAEPHATSPTNSGLPRCALLNSGATTA